MKEEDVTLQSLLAHLYGPTFGRHLAELADAKEGERVLILNAEPSGPSGWRTDDDLADLTPSGLDEQQVPDPLPVIEFHAWGPERGFENAISDRWDVVFGLPPQGHPKKTEDEFRRFLDALERSAHAGSRAFLFLTMGAVANSAGPSLRRPLLESGHIETLLFVESHGGTRRPGLGTSVPLAVPHWTPSREGDPRTTVVRVTSTSKERPSFRVQLPPDEPWTFPGLDPERAQHIERWAREGDAQPLEQVADFPRGTVESPDGQPVLMPRQITDRGIDLTVEFRDFEPDKDGRLTPLREGDLIGRTIGEPHWTIVTESDAEDGLLTTRQVTVIRATEIDPRYLLAFLRSDAASLQLEEASVGATIPRVSMRALRDLLVPVVNVESQALHEQDPIQKFREHSSELASQLESRYRSAFDEPDATSVSAALAGATDDATMAADLLRRVTDPLHRARQFLPHPLARTIRVFENHRRAGRHVDVYQDLLRFGETAIILLGAVGLAYKHEQGAEVEESWVRRFERGGVLLGTWLDCANAGAEAARRADEPLGGLASALSTNSPLNQVLDSFLHARNEDAHGAGPRSPYEYQQSILDLEESLHAAVDELGPLARSDWFVVEQLAWSSERGTFMVSGRSLKGDHPDFDHWIEERRHPLEDEAVHVRLGRTDLSLGGFCLLKACSVCLHEELYYPDKLRGSIVRLRSLDRGHQTEMPVQETGLSFGD